MTALLFDDLNCTVEIGFSTTSGANTVPLGALLSDIVWTDVTAYVRGLSFTRGRSNELDTFQTGSASVVLANADRRFDPSYSSSPYNGALTPLRPIQITVSNRDDFGSTTITPVFFGFIDGWPQTYETYGDATVTVNASDPFKVFNQLTLPGLWEDTIAGEYPLAWLRFNDGVSYTLNDEGSTGSDWRWSDPQVWGLVRVQGKSVAGLIADDSNQAGEFTDGTKALSSVWAQPLLAADYSVEFWFQSSQGDSESYGLCSIGQGQNAVWVQMVSYLGYGVVQACIGNPFSLTPNFDVYTSAVLVNDGAPHHVVINYGTTPGLYVDGVAATKTADDVATQYGQQESERGIVGGYSYYTFTYKNSRTFNGTIDEFLIWDHNLTTGTIDDHYALGVGTFAAGERTDERVTRILDLVEWPSDGRELGVGLSTMQGARTQGKTALAALQECEAAEQGMLFSGTAGTVEFRTRDDFARLTVQTTFGDSGTELGYQDIVIEQSDADIANRVTVSRNNGGTYARNDTTSQGQYFIRALEVTDLESDSDQFCDQLAIDLLRRYKNPQSRIRSLSGTLRGKTGSQKQSVLNLLIGDKVTVKRRPQSVGSAISQTLQIQSVQGEIGADNMVMSFDLGPAPTQFFVLDDSTNGVLDTSRLGL